MQKHQWKQNEPAPRDFIQKHKDTHPAFLLELLWARGVRKEKEIEEFLNPDYERDLHDPTKLKDIEKAAERIWQAVEDDENIMVYGDYDADGICASAILGTFFREIGVEHGVYMPNRATEGHGLNQQAVEEFVQEGVDLIITVDCGTTNNKEIAYARENNSDVVVVDHHQVVGEVPPAYALVNPHQPDATYPFPHLSGAGLTFKLFQVLARDSRAEGRWDNGKERWLLDLVALSTVADMVPLVGENRSLVHYGLVTLAQTRRPGLQELFAVSGIEPTFDPQTLSTNLDSVTIGFSLGPRINAASRMAHAALGYNLLMAEDKKSARRFAQKLEEHNRQRKKDIRVVVKEVRQRIEEKKISHFIVESSPSWPIGLLGLAASRIQKKYTRPVMLIEEQEEVAKASLRAPDGFDVVAALDAVSKLLIQYGGHTAAAGASLKKEQIPALKKQLNSYAKENFTLKQQTPSVQIDAELPLANVSLENAELVEKLAPFGQKNPQPRFVLSGLTLNRIKMLGNENKHAKLFFTNSPKMQKPALLFFHDGLVEKLSEGKKYDIVGELAVNEWQGRREPQLKIVDIRPQSE